MQEATTPWAPVVLSLDVHPNNLLLVQYWLLYSSNKHRCAFGETTIYIVYGAQAYIVNCNYELPSYINTQV
jgi:hypothetical protein